MVQVTVTAALGLRFAVLAALLPFLGHRTVPFLWRLALSLCLALAVAPLVLSEYAWQDLAINRVTVLVEAWRSLFLGALLAIAISIPFSAVKYAGQLTGMQIGFAIVNTIDPQSGAQHSVLAQLYYLLAAMIFFAIDGHRVIVAGLVQASLVLPPLVPFDGAGGAWTLVQDFGVVFSHGLRIAAPCVIVLLLVSATMGVIVKTVPQINVLVVGFPLRIAAGLLTLGLSLVFFKESFLGLARGLESQFDRLLTALY
jgi:flagellar biosynthetic protein FliR